jgi:predicted metal-dependent phosphoesterase TrpH
MGVHKAMTQNSQNYQQWLAEIQERNAKRIEEAKERLGTKYLLHPANHVKRRQEQK